MRVIFRIRQINTRFCVEEFKEAEYTNGGGHWKIRADTKTLEEARAFLDNIEEMGRVIETRAVEVQ